jgi:L-fuconolactonase
MELLRVIDAHHHLWRYNDRDNVWISDTVSALRRDSLAPDIEAAVSESGIDGTIVVQAGQTIEETEWLLDLAGRCPVLLRGVVWVPLRHENMAAHLGRFAQNQKVRKVCHFPHDEADDFFMLCSDFNRGIALLPEFGPAWDILVFERHLPQASRSADRHPRQVLFIDHIAKPRIRDRALSPWKESIEELARRDNVFWKVPAWSRRQTGRIGPSRICVPAGMWFCLLLCRSV